MSVARDEMRVLGGKNTWYEVFSFLLKVQDINCGWSEMLLTSNVCGRR